MSRLIVAIDTPVLSTAVSLAHAVSPHCGLLKLGLEYVMAQGPQGVRAIEGRSIFLDMKLHDIPNTVAASVRALAPLCLAMLTLHAAGGPEMIEAARRAADETANPPLLLAVTVLTSMDQDSLNRTGVSGSVRAQTVRLGKRAMESGADGLICAAEDLPALRDALGGKPVLVTPGIRLPGQPTDDQSRHATPCEAIAAGADWIVVGRPITTAPDPAAMAAAISAQILPGCAA